MSERPCPKCGKPMVKDKYFVSVYICDNACHTWPRAYTENSYVTEIDMRAMGDSYEADALIRESGGVPPK